MCAWDWVKLKEGRGDWWSVKSGSFKNVLSREWLL
jgi:hypothetical protein